jgi:predicted transposase/invertase (TIGR01784 family)
MAITRFLDPKNNFAFLQIFGTEKNKDILIHFLNDILGYKGEEEITEVTFLKTIQDPDIAAYKQSIVDVLCKDKHGVQFIVEMQVSKHRGFEKRAQFYAAKAYSQQVIKEDENHKKMAVYAKLKGVIFLAIADFTMFPDKKEWKSNHRLLDTKTYDNDLKDFYFIFMELEKFNKKIDELETIAEKWAYFFKHAHQSTLEEMEHLIGKDIIIKKAFQAIDQASWTEEELRTYEKLVKNELDNLAVEQQKIEDAEARGEARGETRGKAELLRMMIKQGKTNEEIIAFTGLTREQLEELKR